MKGKQNKIKQGFFMKTNNKNYILLALVTFLLSSMAPNVFANQVKRLKLTAPQNFESAPVIKVISLDGEKWSKVDKTHLSKVTLGFSAKCKYESRGNKNYKGSFNISGFGPVGETEPKNRYIPMLKRPRVYFSMLIMVNNQLTW